MLLGLRRLAETGSGYACDLIPEVLSGLQVNPAIPFGQDVSALYNTGMNTLVRHGGENIETLEKSLALLDVMRNPVTECRPNLRSYNIALNALSKCASLGDESTIDRCLSMLEEMRKSKRNKPDAFTYGSAISVFSKLSQHRKGENEREALLGHCDALYEEMQRKHIKSRVVSSMMQHLPGRGDHSIDPKLYTTLTQIHLPCLSF